jgi:hypothetical protein
MIEVSITKLIFAAISSFFAGISVGAAISLLICRY